MVFLFYDVLAYLFSLPGFTTRDALSFASTCKEYQIKRYGVQFAYECTVAQPSSIAFRSFCTSLLIKHNQHPELDGLPSLRRLVVPRLANDAEQTNGEKNVYDKLLAEFFTELRNRTSCNLLSLSITNVNDIWELSATHVATLSSLKEIDFRHVTVSELQLFCQDFKPKKELKLTLGNMMPSDGVPQVLAIIRPLENLTSLTLIEVEYPREDAIDASIHKLYGPRLPESTDCWETLEHLDIDMSAFDVWDISGCNVRWLELELLHEENGEPIDRESYEVVLSADIWDKMSPVALTVQMPICPGLLTLAKTLTRCFGGPGGLKCLELLLWQDLRVRSDHLADEPDDSLDDESDDSLDDESDDSLDDDLDDSSAVGVVSQLMQRMCDVWEPLSGTSLVYFRIYIITAREVDRKELFQALVEEVRQHLPSVRYVSLGVGPGSETRPFKLKLDPAGNPHWRFVWYRIPEDGSGPKEMGLNIGENLRKQMLTPGYDFDKLSTYSPTRSAQQVRFRGLNPDSDDDDADSDSDA
ncbi:hypothetical protein SCP_1701780 [Sparassis crispa]|uniref:Uncharacterized protein n=1 Tax=Sparassis crispa TaxID=139825 RepID=A0A401H619_9APHY|nr:hypothetical protein SCP_1701780 [Sparassis crispa]GBE89852.1 hypothetical protein SCP_1701780 [Sparassis crispa]